MYKTSERGYKSYKPGVQTLVFIFFIKEQSFFLTKDKQFLLRKWHSLSKSLHVLFCNQLHSIMSGKEELI